MVKAESNSVVWSLPTASRLAAIAFIALVGFGLCPFIHAAAPPNDTCANAQVIPSTGPFPYVTDSVDLSDATILGDPPTPSCPTFPDTASRSVWYRFTPTFSDFYRFSTCADAGAGTTVNDTILAVYRSTNACNSLIEVSGGCADDTCHFQSEIVTFMASGQTFYIVVWQYDDTPPSPGQGLVELLVSPAAPRNDRCETAAPIALNVPIVGTTVSAGDDHQLISTDCFDGVAQTPAATPGRDVVYSFTAPASDSYNIRVRNYNYSPVGSPPGYDLVIYTATECEPDESIVVSNCLAAANRNTSGLSEEINCLPLSVSQTIYIFVDDRYATNRGTAFQLEVTRCSSEREVNGSVEEANTFYSDLSGELNPVNDVDFFALGSFPQGHRVFALLDASAANLPSFEMRVVTTTNTLEFDDRDNDQQFGALSPNIAGTPLASGPSYLRVNLGSSVLTPSGPYHLYAVVQPSQGEAATESEPNNIPLQPNTSSKNYFYGQLPGPGRSSDIDVFAFSAEAGDLIFVSLDGDPLRNNTPVDASLELLNELGSVLLQVDDPNWRSSTNRFDSGLSAITPESPGEALVYRATQTGTYFARVTVPSAAPLAAGSGDYLLSIARNCFAGGGTNTPPIVANLVSSIIGEGQVASLSGKVVDPDAGPRYRVIADFADGTQRVTNTLSVGEYNFEFNHAYSESGNYPVSLRILDNYGGQGVVNTTLIVTNDPPRNAIANLSKANLLEGESVAVSGSFTDAGVGDPHRITIDWGDGSSPSVLDLSAGIYTFNLDHTYQDDPPGDVHTITITVADDDSGTQSLSRNISVSNVAPLLGSLAVTSPIDTGSAATLSASVSDASPLDVLTATINWGDGSSQVTPLPLGSTNFSLTHTYTASLSTNYSIQVSLQDDDGGNASAGTTIHVIAQATPARFKSVRYVGGAVQMTLQGSPSATYRILGSENLKDWTPLASRTADGQGNFQFDDSTPPQRRFYRAVWP